MFDCKQIFANGFIWMIMGILESPQPEVFLGKCYT